MAAGICARQDEAVLVPVLLAMDAKVLFADGQTSEQESFLGGTRDSLVLALILPDPARPCVTRRSRGQQAVAVLNRR